MINIAQTIQQQVSLLLRKTVQINIQRTFSRYNCCQEDSIKHSRDNSAADIFAVKKDSTVQHSTDNSAGILTVNRNSTDQHSKDNLAGIIAVKRDGTDKHTENIQQV